MKLKRITALLAAAAVSAALTLTSYAALEISADGTKLALDQVSSERGATDTVADLTMSWTDGKIIFNFVVTDSDIDNSNADAWNKDSIEVRVDSKDEIRINATTGETGGNAASLYDVDWKLTDTGYEITAAYKNDAVKEGYEFTFAAQVNCASGGARECTLHIDETHENAWQDDSVRTAAVLTAGAVAEAPVPAAGDTAADAANDKASADTGIEGAAVVTALAATGIGAVLVSKKRK